MRFALALLGLVAVAPAAAAPVGGPCDWLVWDAGRGEPQVFHVDADGTPPDALRFDAGFAAAGDAPLARRGGLDLDGDGKTDVLRRRVRPDGLSQAQYVSGGSPGPWIDRGYDNSSDFDRFYGDFDGDGVTDLLTTVLGSPNDTWLLSSGLVLNNVTWNVPSHDWSIAPGVFDDVPSTDLFVVDEADAKPLDYRFIAAASGLSSTFLSSSQPFDVFELRFGDFDANGLTDPFAIAAQDDGTFQWSFSPGGTQAFVPLERTPFGPDDIQFAELDGDGKTDVFVARPLDDGRLEWVYWSAGLGDPIVLNVVDGPVPAFGDFVGDARSDTLVVRCGGPPIRRHPDVMLEPAGLRRIKYFVGDVTGDGLPDVVRADVCQADSRQQPCRQPSENRVGVLISDGFGGFAVGPWQTLGDVSTEFQVNVIGADVSGDGLTDLVYWQRQPDVTELRFTIARAVGDGSFSLGPSQVLTTPFRQFYPTDVDGDGRIDLVGTSPCLIGKGYDFAGCGRGAQATVGTILSKEDGQLVATQPQDLQFDTHDYVVFSADVNGDGKGDLVFHSKCRTQGDSSACLDTDNHLKTFLGNGAGGFLMAGDQVDTVGNWFEYEVRGMVADLDGNGRDDLIWTSSCADSQLTGCTSGGQMRVRIALATDGGPFPFVFLGPFDLGFGYWSAVGDPWIADLDGDGDDDIVFRGILSERQAGAVIGLFSDVAGAGFTFGPLRILPGSGWRDFLDFDAADLTGDSRADFVWFRTANGALIETERVIVAGDLPDPPPTTTTTTTTLPTQTDCSALSGVPGLQCYCDLPLAVGACAGAEMPAKITTGFAKGCGSIDGAASATGKKPAKLLKKGAARLRKVANVTKKKKVRSGLPEGCADTLRAFFTELGARTKQVRGAL